MVARLFGKDYFIMNVYCATYGRKQRETISIFVKIAYSDLVYYSKLFLIKSYRRYVLLPKCNFDEVVVCYDCDECSLKKKQST
jgi:hypothetical protein